MEQPQSAAAAPPPKLPAGLAGVLNAPEENRDSAYYSSTDGSSKRWFPCSLMRFAPRLLFANAMSAEGQPRLQSDGTTLLTGALHLQITRQHRVLEPVS
jgi:hypothetical protein